MSDAVGRIFSIFMAAILMFIVPVYIVYERKQETVQTYVLSETIYFVDNVSNTGKLTKNMYLEYAKKIDSVLSAGKINMTVVRCDSEGNEEYIDTDLKSGLMTDYKIELLKNDYIRVTVSREDDIIAYYGGVIKQ